LHLTRWEEKAYEGEYGETMESAYRVLVADLLLPDGLDQLNERTRAVGTTRIDPPPSAPLNAPLGSLW